METPDVSLIYEEATVTPPTSDLGTSDEASDSSSSFSGSPPRVVPKKDEVPKKDDALGPERGTLGLTITVKLKKGDRKNVNVESLDKMLREHDCLERVSIDQKYDVRKKGDKNIVRIIANACSVSGALRIFQMENGRPFDIKDLNGILEVELMKEDRAPLDFEELDEYHYDYSMWHKKHHNYRFVYNPRWYGQDLRYLEYKKFMDNWPKDEPVSPVCDDNSEVAEFWQKFCGGDFKGLAERFLDQENVVSKEEMYDFYDHLFNAIFDHGMGCIPSGNLNGKEANCFQALTGYIIDILQKRTHGNLMVVQFVPGTFWKSFLDVDPDEDECVGQELRPLSALVSADAVSDIRYHMEMHAKHGPLAGKGAIDWMYGMTCYREKVFYSRLHCKDIVFQILSSGGVFETVRLEPDWETLWQPVLTKDGYERFQFVVNNMNKNLALI